MKYLGTILSILVVILLVYIIIKPPINRIYKYATTPPDLKKNTLIPISSIEYKKYKGLLYRIEPEESSTLNVKLKLGNNDFVCKTEKVYPVKDVSFESVIRKQRHTSLKIKSTEDEDEREECIVWIHGGFFLSGNAFPQYDFYQLLATKMNKPLYIFDYPEHFKYNQKFCIDYIFNVMKLFKGKRIYLMGDSAGSFYCALFLVHNFGTTNKVFDYEKVDVEIINSTLLFGFYNIFTNPVLETVFKLYFLRDGLKIINLPSLRLIPGQLNLISSKKDFLLPNTLELAKYNIGAKVYYYDCDLCVHDFHLVYQSSDETMDLVNKVASFALNIET